MTVGKVNGSPRQLLTTLGDQRTGVTRNTMKTNTLLNSAQLGEPKKTTFNSKPQDYVYGVPKNPDPEGAREVTMIWKEHQANPDDKPGPDFKAMNKKAALNGNITSNQFKNFRQDNMIHLIKGDAVKRVQTVFPSDKDPTYTYGKPNTHRTAEEIRRSGEDDPKIKHLVQHAYQLDWVKMNVKRSHEFNKRNSYIKPRGTKAFEGHKLGAQQKLQLQDPVVEQFKLKRFTNTQGRVKKSLKSPNILTVNSDGQNIDTHESTKCSPGSEAPQTEPLPSPEPEQLHDAQEQQQEDLDLQ